ncbi:hypothetical protein GOAMR_58_00600 [Gordonia amarae NBRC 15530]|uniref:Lipoprotein n=2 Tax=Gordonia amarae TaxID=36821 RepID=G7GSV9_9ACTN|nr:hypothetical protein GOAMR_58_00600 [Gordonia amarae NBRC 15530]
MTVHRRGRIVAGMNALRRLMVCTVLGTFATTAVACGSSGDSADLDRSSTMIAYTHEDGSTAPQFHKEYQIVVADGIATLNLGGYGALSGQANPDVTTTKPVDDKVWKKLVDGVGKLPGKSPDNKPCPGAGTASVKITSNGDNIKDVTVSGCDTADDAKKLSTFIAPVESLFDMKTYLGG